MFLNTGEVYEQILCIAGDDAFNYVAGSELGGLNVLFPYGRQLQP